MNAHKLGLHSDTALICTTCGQRVSGPHRASCNSPTQRFVTRDEWQMMRAIPAFRYIDTGKFKAQREQARLTAKETGANDWELL